MKKIISLILILTLCLSLALSLSSCGAPEDAGAEIKVYLGEEIYDFDFSDYYVSSNQEAVMSLLFDPLFRLSDSGKLLKDGAAKKYSIDKEARTITIELRETHWSDEQRVQAEDYIYAWRNVLLEPTVANPAASLLFDIENAVDIKRGEKSIYELGAVASGVYEITITYREGADPETLLKNLASVSTAPIRQDIYDTASHYWTKVLNYAVTNGPFKIEDVNYEDGTFTLSRNVGYHQLTTVKDYTKQVTPAKLVSFTNPGKETLQLTYKDIEENTVFYMSEATLEDRKANKDNAEVADALSTYSYVFNTDNPLFAIKEVRQALSMAIDREAIIEAITFGKAATGLIPGEKRTALISTSAKIDEAKSLLSGVNFAGVSKTFTLTVDDSEESVAIAEIAKAAWSELGFTVKINKLGAKTQNIVDFKNSETIEIYDSALQLLVKAAVTGTRSFDVVGVDWMLYSTDEFVALSAFSGNYNGAGTDFNEKGFYVSFGGYKSEAYDALIKEAYEATDKKVRAEKLSAAEALLMEDAAICPLVFNQNFAFISKEVKNIDFDGFGNAILTDAKQKNYHDYLYQ